MKDDKQLVTLASKEKERHNSHMQFRYAFSSFDRQRVLKEFDLWGLVYHEKLLACIGKNPEFSQLA